MSGLDAVLSLLCVLLAGAWVPMVIIHKNQASLQAELLKAQQRAMVEWTETAHVLFNKLSEVILEAEDV
jgi:hypothetical protein